MTPAPTQVTPVAHYWIKQRFTPLVNRYEICESDASGQVGRMLAFAQQKRMKSREEVIFYTDDTKTQIFFTFKARNVLDIHGTTDIFDGAGQVIGQFRKDFQASLLRSTYYLGQNGLAEARGQERSTVNAIVRRFTDISFIPYHFDFAKDDGSPVMSVVKKWGLRDKYHVTVYDAGYDFRVLAAMGVALDVLQRR
jgi:uncharacterized protein YxjI